MKKMWFERGMGTWELVFEDGKREAVEYTDMGCASRSRTTREGWLRNRAFMQAIDEWDATAFGATMSSLMLLGWTEKDGEIKALLGATTDFLLTEGVLDKRQKSMCTRRVSEFYEKKEHQLRFFNRSSYNDAIVRPIIFMVSMEGELEVIPTHRKLAKMDIRVADEPIYVGRNYDIKDRLVFDMCIVNQRCNLDKNKNSRYLAGIMGLVVADALGVPVEFSDRSERKAEPVTDMIGYGTYNQPPGTWSDDSSLTLATLDSLSAGYDPEDIAEKLASWHFDAEYTPFGVVFDEGLTSSEAIMRYRSTGNAFTCGSNGERDNGNGSLMRIMPACLYALENSEDDSHAIQIIHTISAITHAHPRSMIACGIYYFIVKAIYDNSDNDSLKKCIARGVKDAQDFYADANYEPSQLEHYSRLGQLATLTEDEIASSGYVVHSLEAALWCLWHTDSYRECTLKAVNLGSDTDTVAAIAGGLAGLYYGYNQIPEHWLAQIVKREWIEELCDI